MQRDLSYATTRPYTIFNKSYFRSGRIIDPDILINHARDPIAGVKILTMIVYTAGN